MNSRKALRGNPCLDVGLGSLKIFSGDRGLEIPLTRLPGGAIDGASRELVLQSLTAFLRRGSGGPCRASCALPARGVALRPLEIPSASGDELIRAIALQVELEFPLPPEDLAWGCLIREGNEEAKRRNGGAAPRRVTLAALRRETIEEYRSLLVECGLLPTFSLGALAGAILCPQTKGMAAVLDIGRIHSELLVLEDGRPMALRTLPWGGQTVTQAIAGHLGISPADAEKLKLALKDVVPGNGGVAGDIPTGALQAALEESFRQLLQALREELPPAPEGSGSRCLFLIGGGSRLCGFTRSLEKAFGGSLAVRRLEVGEDPGISAAILGLKRLEISGELNGTIHLDVQTAPNGRGKTMAGAPGRFWIILAAVLVMVFVGLAGYGRYGGAFLQSELLDQRIGYLGQRLLWVPRNERELSFLAHLEASQPPILEVITVIARAAPPGTTFTSFSLNRQGELAIQGSLPNFQAAGAFRAQCNASGWFSQVVLQDQSPSKDKSRVDVRFTARLKPQDARPVLEDPKPGEEPPEAPPVQETMPSVIETPPPPSEAGPSPSPAEGPPRPAGEKKGGPPPQPQNLQGMKIPNHPGVRVMIVPGIESSGEVQLEMQEEVEVKAVEEQ